MCRVRHSELRALELKSPEAPPTPGKFSWNSLVFLSFSLEESISEFLNLWP